MVLNERGGGENLQYGIGSARQVAPSGEYKQNTINNLPPVVWHSLVTDLDFVLLGFQTCTTVAHSCLH